MKSIQTRMLLFILGPTIIALLGLSIFISTSVYNKSTTQADNQLQDLGNFLSIEVENVLLSSVNAVHTMSSSVQSVLENSQSLNREQTDSMLKWLMDSNDNNLTAWMLWEPNAFDGNDASYANADGHDKTGRYIPVWSKNDKGEWIVEPNVGYDTPGEVKDRFDVVFQSGELTIFEPLEYSIGGKMVLITSVVAPIKVNGKVVGMTGVDISLDSLESLARSFKFYDTGFAGLLSNQGYVLAHPSNELVGTDFMEAPGLVNHEGKESIRAAIKEGKSYKDIGFSESTQSNVYRQFTPITIQGISTPWSTLLVVPTQEVMADANKIAKAITITSLLVIIGIGSIIYYVSSTISGGLETAAAIGQHMEKGDFTQEIPAKFIKRADEIGQLSRTFESVSSRMRTVLGEVQQSATHVVSNAVSVDERAIESSNASQNIAQAIATVAESSEAQMKGAEENAKAMEDMAHGVHSVAQAATVVSDATNEMISNASAGQQTIQQAAEQMKIIYDGTTETEAIISKLATSANEIQHIVTAITDVSEQTNLLALNAAIEAARAGEAGKGFAVVADEVRKLADETNRSASTIQELLESIQKASVQATESMNVNGEQVHLGITRMNDVESSFRQILQTVEHIVKETIELSAVSEQMSASSEEIAAGSEEIATSAESSYEQTHQVAAASQQQLASMEEVSNSSTALKELATNLQQLLQQFKI